VLVLQSLRKHIVGRRAVFRALGIPSRPVTNFVSARDTNHTLSVDKYFDIFGDEMKGGPDGDNQDAIWNFHAWYEF
jgi:transglutaminase 1